MVRKTRMRRPRRVANGKSRRRRLRMRAIPDPVVSIDVPCDHKFALFGCWGKNCEPGSAQALIADTINKKCNIEFMVTAGDNFYVDHPSLVDFDKNVVHCYSKPMYASMGNHDIKYYDQELDFQHPNWNLPAKNYVMRIVTGSGAPRLRIVMINTNPIYAAKDYGKVPYLPPGQIEDDMMELMNFLDNLPPSDLFTVMVGHHPLIKNRHKEKSMVQEGMDEFGKRIASMCHVYICADEHNLQHMVHENLNQFILGGGGGDPDETVIVDHPEATKFVHPYHGFGVFDVRKMKMTVKCMDKTSGKISNCYKHYF